MTRRRYPGHFGPGAGASVRSARKQALSATLTAEHHPPRVVVPAEAGKGRTDDLRGDYVDLQYLRGQDGGPAGGFTIIGTDGDGPPVHLGITEVSDALHLAGMLASWAIRAAEERTRGTVTSSGGYRVATIDELRAGRPQLEQRDRA